jgi:hypothetical protein
MLVDKNHNEWSLYDLAGIPRIVRVNSKKFPTYQLRVQGAKRK